MNWRRETVIELTSKGYSQTEIARELKISKATVSRDMAFIRNDFFRRKAEFYEQMYLEYITSIYGINQAIKKLWQIIDDTASSRKEQMQAIALLNDTYLRKANFMDAREATDEIMARSSTRPHSTLNFVNNVEP